MIHNYSSGREEDKNELKKRIKLETMATWITRLEEFGSGHLPFMCLLYKGKDSVHQTIHVVFIGRVSHCCMRIAEGKDIWFYF